MNPAFPSLLPALPELILACGAMALLMVGAYRGQSAGNFVNWCAILLLVVAAAVVWWIPGDKLTTFGTSFVLDGFARFLKILTFIGSAAAIFLSLNYLKVEKQERFEYSILILLATTGMGMMISASDLIALYL